LARRRYRQFVWEGISTGHEEKYYQVKDQRYLGEDSFIDRIERERKEAGNWVYDIALGTISQEVSKATGIRRDKLYSVTRGREGAGGRGIVAYLARMTSGYSVKEIADHFRRSPVTIGEAITKVEDLLRTDEPFEKMIRGMTGDLIKGRKRKYRVSVA
jgi:chromosomal replication initiation ATPase DnaA